MSARLGHRSRKIWTSLLTVVFAAGINQVASMSGAEASTQCSVNYANDNWTQFCEYNDTYAGAATFKGTSTWNYADSREDPDFGLISGKLYDVEADGHCAIGKVGWEADSSGPITWVVNTKVCGNGSSGGLAGPGTTGEVTLTGDNGIYLFELCSPASSCTTLWKMNTHANHPSS